MSRLSKTTVFVMLTFLLFSLIFLVGTTPAYALSTEDLINNTTNNPYTINNKQDFLDLANLVNTGSTMLSKHFLLAIDIDLSLDTFTPIGSSTNMFQGSFDGGNHKITVNISNTNTYNGLFGYIGNSGLVKNVIVAGNITANSYLGGIAGYNAGSIVNCINTANLSIASVDARYIGGICGENIGKIDSCINAGNIIANSYSGGIAGRNLSTTQGIFACVNLGDLNVTTNYLNATRVGGLVGESRAIIANSYNYAFVNAMGDRIGSIVGYLISAPIGSINCYNITAKSARSLVGQSDVVRPASFLAKTLYDFLEKTVVFADNTMRNLDFIQAYGFLSYPNTLNENAVIKNKMKVCLFGGGNGDSGSPFLINDINQWNLFAVNSYLFDYHLMQINLNFDINLGQTQPLFLASNPFRGIFEGQYHSITINLSGVSNVGLFAATEGSIIRNFTLNGTVSASGDVAGAAVGLSLGGAIGNITNNCNVTAKNFCGGLVGKATTSLLSFSGTKNYGVIRGESQVGGLIGEGNAIVITDSENYGDILATTSTINNNIGGVAGLISGEGAFSSVFNSGEVSAYKGTNVGGIIGSAKNCNITKVANVNNIKGKNNVGGICGYSVDTIENNYNLNGAMCVSNVTGASNIAGILGNATGFIKAINNSYFAGTLNEVTEATINLATFKPISNSTNLSNSFFNSDLLPTYAGMGKNYIELTDNVFGVDGSDSVWLANAMTASTGYYPIMKLNALVNNATLINNKLKISYFSGGTGTAIDPYLIANEQALRNFAYLNNNYAVLNYATKFYKLTSDITLKRTFTTVCSSILPFDGNFDGNYKIINNLNITGGEYTGFFASLGTNANVSKFFVESGNITGTNYVGTIAGFAQYGAKVNDSYSNATLVTEASSGGLVGVNYGLIIDSFFAGRITGTSDIGGIAGKNGLNGGNKGTITKCFSLGYTVGNGNVGGIVGLNQGDISICQVSGTVHLNLDSTYSGGIAGESLKGAIANCYVTAVLTTANVGSKIGGLVGQFTNTGDSTLVNCYYHPIITKALTPYYISNTPWADTTGRIKNSEQMLNNAFLGDLDYNFGFGLTPSKDSDFAPRILSFINTGIERKEFYSAESAKLRIFDWDNTSQAIWGGKDNPYIISTPTQLNNLSNLVATYKYTYAGNYFILANDINMQGISFMPIGRFISASNPGNFVFNAVFDGKGHTISNISVNRTYSYIGLFGFTGSNFILRNLTLADSCNFITSTTYAGSLVGYNGGTIDRCVSYATVSASNYIGGLCAYSALNTTITNSVFFGGIPVATYSYGILGLIPGAGISLNTSNTWYIYKNNTSTNIKASALPYMHNDYGSVLFVDRLGSVNIIVDTLSIVNANILTFQINADPYYSGAVMTNIDGLIYSGNNFLPYLSFNGVKNISFVRFCQTARLNFALPEESAHMENYLGNYGSGSYYEGQSVDFTIKLEKGYYLDNLAYYTMNNYLLKNVSTDIVMRFTMGSNALGIYFDVPISIKDASSLVSVTSSAITLSNIYDGQAKSVEVAFSDVFDYYTMSYYYGLERNNVGEIKNAGQYVVYTYLYMIGNRSLFFGIMENNFTILPYELTLDTSLDAINNYWSSVVAVKTYDGTDKMLGRTIENQYFLTIVLADLAFVNIKADILWANANSGSNITTLVSNFILSGTMSVNYSINSGTTLTLENKGRIDKKQLIVTIPSNDLSMEYSGNKPIIKNPQVNGSLGSTSLVWTYAKLNEESEIDIEWGNLAVKTYFVGAYNIAVGALDSNNYAISFGVNSYIFNILPKEVSSIRYSDYENKVYSGGVLSGNIKAVYDTFNGIDFASLTYYKDSVSVENKINGGVINAGSYVAVPTISNVNYKLANKISPLNFVVAKSTSGGEITFSLDDTNLKINDIRELTFISDIYDATISLEIKGASRAKISLTKELSKFYFVPTAYSSSGSVEYRIAAKGATNYTDRYSSYKIVEIAPLNIYVGVLNRTHVYGDIISLELQYSSDIAQNNLISMETVESLAGYRASSYVIAYSKFEAGQRYTVNIDGGDFDGYKILNANTCYIDIVKREIKVTVSPEMTTNTKVYGDADTTINYIVVDNSLDKQMSILPNGEALVLSGKLSRASGEATGKYAITQGTLNTENNINYQITNDFRGEYSITQRPIRLFIPIVNKYYGMAEPIIRAQIEDGYSFAYNDNLNSITLTITRASGEDVGRYNYTVSDSSGGRNYRIESIRNDGYFEILRGEPSVTYNIQNTLYYGNKVSTLNIIGQAYYGGSIVPGTFSWAYPDTIATSMENVITTVRFTPNNTNFTEKDSLVALPVQKRKIDVSFVGELEYIYNGKQQCNINEEFTNVYNGDTITTISSVDSTPISAGKYVYTVEIDSDRYVISNENTISFVIYPKNVTVTVQNLTILKGERANFVISYEGFVEGEDEDFITKAKVDNVPTQSGRHTIVASGASSDNYDFTYISGILTIYQKEILGENVIITGVIRPGITVETKIYESKNVQFQTMSVLIDKSLGVNVLKPSKNALEQYVGIDFSETIYEDYAYTVSFSQPIVSGNTIYVLNNNGEAVIITEYTLSEDGKTVTFMSSPIAGVAIYSEKGKLEFLKGYIPLAVACTVCLVVILIVGISIAMKLRHNKAKKAYLKFLDK